MFIFLNTLILQTKDWFLIAPEFLNLYFKLIGLPSHSVHYFEHSEATLVESDLCWRSYSHFWTSVYSQGVLPLWQRARKPRTQPAPVRPFRAVWQWCSGQLRSRTVHTKQPALRSFLLKTADWPFVSRRPRLWVGSCRTEHSTGPWSRPASVQWLAGSLRSSASQVLG